MTISELARLAGVSVRAVRTYHARGLLAEPPRAANGYRRYGPDHLLALVRIRRLRELGLPLARIRELVDAPHERWRRALSELDADLGRQQSQLRRRRHALARALELPGDLVLPPRLADLLERARRAGYPESGVSEERDAMLLSLVLAPEATEQLVALYEQVAAALDAVAGVDEIGLAYESLAGVQDPDDPRVESVAAGLVAIFEPIVRQLPSAATQRVGDRPADRLAARLVEQFWAERASPAQQRVNELVNARMPQG